MDLISIQHLGVGQRLMDINLTLKAGEMLGVIGANGAGKSTLLHCLAGIQDHQGEIHLAGTAIRTIPERQRAQQLGFLPQSSSSAWALTVRDVISLGRLPWGDDNADAIAQAAAAAGVDAPGDTGRRAGRQPRPVPATERAAPAAPLRPERPRGDVVGS